MTGASRPALGYWPDPADAPAREPRRERVTLVAPDGAIVRGTWSTAMGLALGIGLTVATGVLVWPLVGAVAGVGVGDLVAGGRR